MQKAEKYLDKIVAAKDADEAVALLHELAKDLGIGQSYGKLLHIEGRLKLHKESFKKLQKQLKDQDIPDVKFLQDLRHATIVCYQTLNDELTKEINRLKIYYGEDKRSSVKSNILLELNKDDKFKEENKIKSMSALKDVWSVHSDYEEYLSCQALAYGLWNDLRDTLEYIKMFIDSLASQIRTEQNALRMDLK